MELDRAHAEKMLEQMLKYASAQALEAIYDAYAEQPLEEEAQAAPQQTILQDEVV